MTIESNLFEQGGLMKGALAYSSVANAMNVRTNPASSTDVFTAGMPVKLIDGDQKDILVDKADVEDAVYGFMTYNARKEEFDKGEVIVIAKQNDVMIMEAGEAFAVGSKLMMATGDKVVVYDGTSPLIGLALQKANADEDLVKVEILTPVVSVGVGEGLAFTDLTDTPAIYDGSANDTVKVNGTNDGLEFVTV